MHVETMEGLLRKSITDEGLLVATVEAVEKSGYDVDKLQAATEPELVLLAKGIATTTGGSEEQIGQWLRDAVRVAEEEVVAALQAKGKAQLRNDILALKVRKLKGEIADLQQKKQEERLKQNEQIGRWGWGAHPRQLTAALLQSDANDSDEE